MNTVYLLLENKYNRQLLREMLDDEYSVFDTAEFIPDRSFDLLITDVAMIEKFGEKLLDRKKKERTCFLPFVLVAAHPDQEILARKWDDIIDEVLETPLKQPLLRLRIKALMRTQNQSLEIYKKTVELKELSESEESYHTLADNISQLVWMADSSGLIIWYNKRWYEYTGTTFKQMLGAGWKTVYHPDHVERFAERMQQAGNSGEMWRDTFPLRGKDGKYRWFLFSAEPVKNEFGEIIRWIGTNTDIAEIKQAQDELGVAAERFRRITSSNIIGTIIADFEGAIYYANDYFLNIIGYSREEFQQSQITWIELTPQEYIARHKKALQELGATGVSAPHEQQYIRKDGTRVWVLLADVMFSDPAHKFFAFVLDITDRKQALAEAESRRAEIEAVVKSIPDGYVMYDKDGRIIALNDRAVDVMGITPRMERLSYELHLKELNPLTLDGHEFPIGMLPSSRALHGETVHDVVMRLHKGDKDIWISESAAPVSIDGRMLGAIMEFVDVTKQHELQMQLTDERNFVNTILETSGALFVVINKNGAIVRFNGECERLTGYSAREALGRQVSEFVPDDEKDGVGDILKRLLSGEKINENENHWLTRSGEKRFIRWRNSAMFNENGELEYMIGTGIDISDRGKLEEQLTHRAQELALVNRELESFSYSVSHDLRGPLSAISGFATILLEYYGEKLDEEGRDYLGRINEGVKKMHQLIDSLLSLSRIGRQDLKKQNIDLSVLVTNYLSELKKSQPQRNADFIVAPDVHADADPNLIQIALENLLRNAWKFTSKRDVTRIEFGVENLDGQRTCFVRDNGAGFNMKFAEKIFEPFKRGHTDKEFGGTGIGLSIVQRIIARHGGKVWAEGEEGKGAVFFFTLG